MQKERGREAIEVTRILKSPYFLRKGSVRRLPGCVARRTAIDVELESQFKSPSHLEAFFLYILSICYAFEQFCSVLDASLCSVYTGIESVFCSVLNASLYGRPPVALPV